MTEYEYGIKFKWRNGVEWVEGYQGPYNSFKSAKHDMFYFLENEVPGKEIGDVDIVRRKVAEWEIIDEWDEGNE